MTQRNCHQNTRSMLPHKQDTRAGKTHVLRKNEREINKILRFCAISLVLVDSRLVSVTLVSDSVILDLLDKLLAPLGARPDWKRDI